MYRKLSDHRNEREKNLSKAYSFKNDFNLDLKSSRVPASTISFDKLFQSFTILIKKEYLKQLIFEDFKKKFIRVISSRRMYLNKLKKLLEI